MINLLPPSEKGILVLEKRKKMAAIIWFLAFFFVISLGFIFFLINAYLQLQLDAKIAVFSDAEVKLRQSEINDLEVQMTAVNQTLTKLESFYKNKFYFTQILEKISATLSSGLYLTNLSIAPSGQTETEDAGLKVNLSGFAETREDLFEFKKNLESTNGIQAVNFPASSWMKPTNINFFVNFNIKK